MRIAKSFALGVLALAVSACSTVKVEPPAELVRLNSPKPVDVAWQVALSRDEIPVSVGVFRPAVNADTVAAADASGRVVLLDRQSGAARWQRDLGEGLSTGVTRDSGKLYVVNDRSEVIALLASDGSELWRQRFLGEIITPPAAGLNRVWVRTTDGELAVLSADSGQPLWSGTIPPPALTIRGQGQPLLVKGGALVGFADGRVLALSGDDGRRLWSTTVTRQRGQTEVERLADVDGTIGADERYAYAASYQGRVAKIDPVNGRIIWAGEISTSTGVHAQGDGVFVSDDQGSVWRFAKDTGDIVWKQEALRLRRLSGVQSFGDQHIAVADFEGYVHLLDKASGDLVGRVQLDGDGLAGELVAEGDRLYAQGRNGRVYSILSR